MMRRCSTFAVVAFVTLSAACAKSSADGGCNAEEMAGLRKALPTVTDADARARIISVGLGEACTDLPKGIAKAMVNASNDPATRSMLVASAVADNLGFVKGACPDVEQTFGAIAVANPDERGAIAYKGCALSRLDLVTEAEMTTAMNAVGSSALVAAAVFVWLGDHGMPKAEAKSLARGMLLLP